MSSLQPFTDLVNSGGTLSLQQAADAIDCVMRGDIPAEDIAALLAGLADRGETVDEVAGAALSLRRHMVPIRTSRQGVVDTCGTGGGGSNTFNVSTTAAIVAAAAGLPVAKHGNRSVTSRSGSADVLAALGVNIDASLAQVEACLDELGLCFCYAPIAHPAMKHVAAARNQLGRRTIFNLLGPLANPAAAAYQLLGAGRPEVQPLLAGAIAKLGTAQTLVVSGHDGLGDVTIATTTSVTRVSGDGVDSFTWSPEEFGIARNETDSLTIDGPAASAAVIMSILDGEQSPRRDIVVLNAAATLIAAEACEEPLAASQRAAEAIDSGRAKELLAALIERSHRRA